MVNSNLRLPGPKGQSLARIVAFFLPATRRAIKLSKSLILRGEWDGMLDRYSPNRMIQQGASMKFRRDPFVERMGRDTGQPSRGAALMQGNGLAHESVTENIDLRNGRR